MCSQIVVRVSGHNNNFGDIISPVLIEKITGQKPVEIRGRNKAMGTSYLVAGSIIKRADPGSVVWGAGVLNYLDQDICKDIDVRCVRGPLTVSYLKGCGIKCPDKFGDPVLLAPRLLGAKKEKLEFMLGVIPHSSEEVDRYVRFQQGMRSIIIDIKSGIKNVVDLVARCGCIASSSLHGLVIADALGIPAIWAGTFQPRWPLKFYDYMYSVSVRPLTWVDITDVQIDRIISIASKREVDTSVAVNNLIETCPWSTNAFN